MEIIVVAVIVAALAAVAIPLYSGYIKGQKRQAALALAQTAAITASSIKRRTGIAPTTGTLNAALSLPNASQFAIRISGSFVIATEQSKPPPDTVEAAAGF